MEGNLSQLGPGDMRLPVHRLELSRIRFMINSYLRLRLAKLQAGILHYTSEDNPGRLTEEEAVFAAQHRRDLLDHFNCLALQHLPGTWDPTKAADSSTYKLDRD